MHRRRIRLAGALLLTSLLLSFAEATWASMCDPSIASSEASGTPSMETAPMADMAMPPMPDMPAGHDCPPGHAHDPAGPESDDANCPFSPPGGTGCLSSASLPAATADVKAPPPTKALAERSAHHVSPPLQTHSIFHPPKA